MTDGRCLGTIFVLAMILTWGRYVLTVTFGSFPLSFAFSDFRHGTYLKQDKMWIYQHYSNFLLLYLDYTGIIVGENKSVFVRST